MFHTPQRERVIKIYEKLTKTKLVRPSYRTVAKTARVSLGTAFRTIQLYLEELKETKKGK